MDKISEKLTVFYEEPFWVGVFERISNGNLSVCKVIFGAEPKEYEVYEYILKNYDQLRFSQMMEIDVKKAKHNPKRIQREVHKETQNNGIGTKSQQALKLQLEQRKMERKIMSHEQREAERKHQFELKQQKKKEKHKGR